MKKNNKGFFLAETIVVVALVTTVMAFLYPNISNLYDNYNNRTKYYDQTEDLYALIAISDFLSDNDFLSSLTTSSAGVAGCKEFTNDMNMIYERKETTSGFKGEFKNIYSSQCKVDDCNSMISNFYSYIPRLKELYLTEYMASPSSNNYNFNRYLKRMKKTTYDGGAYRLIGVFEATDKDENGNNITITRYASIKIDNPNPGRGCNLGG